MKKNIEIKLLIFIIFLLGVLVWINRYSYVLPNQGLPMRINNFNGEICHIPFAPAKSEWKCIKNNF